MAEHTGETCAGGPPQDRVVKRQTSSHKVHPDVVFAFHDKEEIGPRMLARLAKHTGLTPGDL